MLSFCSSSILTAVISTDFKKSGTSMPNKKDKEGAVMTRARLCLALSLPLAFMQAASLAAPAVPEADSIWQQMSSAPVKVKQSSVPVRSRSIANAKSTPMRVAVKPQVLSGDSDADGHALLFLSSKSKYSSVLSGTVPAAALTIHPTLVNDVLQDDQVSGQEISTSNDKVQSSDLSLNRTTVPPTSALALPAVTSVAAPPIVNSGNNGNAGDKAAMAKSLFAQLAPDQLIAQSDQAVTVTPIPSVVTGTVDLEEFKSTNVIDLKVSQSRTFKLKNKIVRSSISDPTIAEPVVVAENQIVLLGKAPGGATLVLWDDAGNSMAIDLRVTRDFSQLQSALREVDPRIIVKAFSVGGTDRVLLLGDVDHPESVIRAFGSANVFMDDRGMNIQVANSRLINSRIGEQGGAGGGGGGGGSAQLAQLGNSDRYTFFPNLTNNISKAQVITSDGGRVTSLIKVRKVPLIVLHVTFMEVNSVAARELGVQLGLAYTGNHFAFGVGGNNTIIPAAFASAPAINHGVSGLGTGPFTVAPSGFISSGTVMPSTLDGQNPISGIGQGVLNAAPGALLTNSVLLGAPGGANFGTSNLSNIFFSQSSIQMGQSGIFSINPTVQGIITHSRARILAEPTLVTISGERAAFLAGGEIPIIQATAVAGATAQSVTFEPFGLRLNLIPVLMENGNINLEVSPEERLISSVISFQPSSLTSSIPGFTTRKAQTIVEMKPGQELFIAGMISTNSGRDMIKTPILGEIPVLGALYRSKAFTKNESELVVAVRPEIILPGSPGQLKMPEEIGRVEGVRDTNLFQVEPTVMDERHYSSGRSERYQKTSPTLPEGSPIPDNE
jgi:Flp pilus assembly secretin CpaC